MTTEYIITKERLDQLRNEVRGYPLLTCSQEWVIAMFDALEDELSKQHIRPNGIGDKVMICRTSQYYRKEDKHNPIGIIGEITSWTMHDQGVDVDVMWRNGESNCYNPEDLVLMPD